MTRIRLLQDREAMTPTQQAIFDWFVESRGRMLRPYEILLHVPGLARPAAELGHQIRYEGSLADHDRELSILTAARFHKSEFEWEAHLGLARDAGVSEQAIAVLEGGDSVPSHALTDRESLLIGFIHQLCVGSTVSDDIYHAAEDALGTGGVVELTTLVGYYTMLAFVMNVAGVD